MRQIRAKGKRHGEAGRRQQQPHAKAAGRECVQLAWVMATVYQKVWYEAATECNTSDNTTECYQALTTKTVVVITEITITEISVNKHL
ncbi:hypothetical protein E2C01_045814 [Portunus trituberculatus]|uniref:Uncharacterized protein n=1 Tax=Portunus trituberculatus TaxID=210409 RepID=A0A5B7G2E1_PORTR|nr:hypothetical protein [Portunus trituberculatus]